MCPVSNTQKSLFGDTPAFVKQSANCYSFGTQVTCFNSLFNSISLRMGMSTLRRLSSTWAVECTAPNKLLLSVTNSIFLGTSQMVFPDNSKSIVDNH